MSYVYITDSPVAALLSSIFIGPLGLQGWLINPANHGDVGKYQRMLSYALPILFVVVCILMVNKKKKDKKKDIETLLEEMETGKDGSTHNVSLNITRILMGITAFISFILACIIVSRAN